MAQAAPLGLCPRCLLSLGFVEESGGSDRYVIGEKISEGGMGEVFLALDTTLDREVVLKFPSHELQKDGLARNQLLREARAAAALDHPFICKIYDAGELDGRAFIAMEFVRGSTLQELVSEGRLPVEKALEIGASIADALQAAHAGQFVHRDLKPGNIMLTPEGHPKVLDFGLATRSVGFASDSASTTATIEGSASGTLPYMAPEQLMGRTIDSRSDIFAFGVVIYELLTGTHPFRRSTPYATAEAIVHEEPVAPSSEVPGIQPGVDDIVMKLLAKRPRDRFQSAAEARKALLEQSQASSISNSTPPARSRILIPGSFLLLLFIVLLLALGPWSPFTTRVGPEAIRTLAVLPFENLSGDNELEYVADGMTDALILSLGRIQGFAKVVSRSSSMRYKDRNLALPEIAEELGVTGVVEGSVLLEGEKISIRARLIDAAHEIPLWGQAYEGDFEDIVSLQNEVARDIAEQIQVQLSAPERSRLAASPVVNVAAHKSYMRGVFSLNSRTRGGLEQAVRYFERTIRDAPEFAPAYAGLADAYSMMASTAYESKQPREIMPLAKKWAREALRLDDELSDAHSSLANASLSYDWDLEAAEVGFRRAIELNPNNSVAHVWYSLSLFALRKPEEALAEARIASELDPSSPLTLANLGRSFYYRRDYSMATRYYQEALGLDPNFRVASLGLALVHLAERDLDQAMRALKESFRDSEATLALLDVLDDARNAAQTPGTDPLESMRVRAGEMQVPSFYLAMAYLILEDRERAIDWLEVAVRERSEYVVYLNVDPAFEGLRAHPRFQRLLDGIGLDG